MVDHTIVRAGGQSPSRPRSRRSLLARSERRGIAALALQFVATGASAGAARDDSAWGKAGAKNREECCGDYDALSSRSENPVAAPFAPMPVAVVVS